MLQGTRSIQLTHGGSSVLRSSSVNHYKPSSVLVFIQNSPNRQALRPLLILELGRVHSATRPKDFPTNRYDDEGFDSSQGASDGGALSLFGL
jgi:hypothetical protein